MSQGLPNPTGSDKTQGKSASVTPAEPQESASGNATAILEGATGFVKVLEQDERLIGGILISIPVVLTVIIFVIPAEQRFTLTCLMLGSVLGVGLFIFLLIRHRKKLDRENLQENLVLQHTNNTLKESERKLKADLEASKNELKASTRERVAFLLELKSQVNQITKRAKTLPQNDEITRNEVIEINLQVSSLDQHIQNALKLLQAIDDSEALKAAGPFEEKLFELMDE